MEQASKLKPEVFADEQAREAQKAMNWMESHFSRIELDQDYGPMYNYLRGYIQAMAKVVRQADL